jgi:hypothetical protein
VIASSRLAQPAAYGMAMYSLRTFYIYTKFSISTLVVCYTLSYAFMCYTSMRSMLTPNVFGPETSAIESSLKLSCHPYKEHPKRTSYELKASCLVGAARDSELGLNLSCFTPPPRGD